MDSVNVSGGITGHQNVDEHQAADDWRIAKSVVDPDTGREYTERERRDATVRTVEKHWRSAQYEQLESSIGGGDVVFVTMPSTSGMNMLTPHFARSVREYFLGRGRECPVVFGEDLVEGVKSRPIKKMKRKKRIFEYRPFDFPDDEISRTALEELRRTPVVILEDAILSGASIKGFYDALEANGVAIRGIACLIGDPGIRCGEDQRAKLESIVKDKEIVLAASSGTLLKYMSRWQAGELIDRLDKVNARDRNAIGQINDRILRFVQQTKLGGLAGNLQGVPHRGVAGVLGGLEQGRGC
jgi:hypothetical protein